MPAPLTLTTPPFRLSDKSSGHYSGKLRIVYTPTTQTGS
ncbi:CfaE/CblD family pilus tip adhesin [Pantoea stewartii]